MGKALLILIVLIFVLVLGGGVSKRIHMAVAPPVYDPMTYYLRAELVWSALAKGDLHGVLNGPMSVRPPGTAFVLYPFGFRASVHSFLFRSVFAPLLIWAISLIIPIATRVRCRCDALLGGALIVGLLTMPLFYHFELNELFTKTYNVSNQWGLVDPLQGAAAALAISILCLGIANRSVNWCSVGWLFSVLTLFIKPSGLLIMIAVVGVATVEFVVHYFGSHSDRRPIFKFAASVYLVGFTIYGLALWLAFGSDYMSREVIAQAIKGQQFVLYLNQGRGLFAMLALFVVPVLGWWWFCPGIFYSGCAVVEAVQSVAKRQWSAVGLRVAAAGLILISAVCWWNFLAGQEHRYLFPFLLMVIAWFIPEVFQRVRQLGPSARGAVIVYCLAPAILLGGMLWSKQPPIIFQQLMGVNLSAGGYASEVKQGKWLFAESEKVGRPLNLYSLGSYGVGVVETVDWVKSIEKKTLPGRFAIKRPLNWIDTPGLRIEELLQSDFLLLEDVRAENASEALPVSSWSEEVERFKQFAYSERGTDKNGLELVSDGTVKVLRVANAHNFSATLYAWANSIHWADDFRDRNKAFLEKSPK